MQWCWCIKCSKKTQSSILENSQVLEKAELHSNLCCFRACEHIHKLKLRLRRCVDAKAHFTVCSYLFVVFVFTFFLCPCSVVFPFYCYLANVPKGPAPLHSPVNVIMSECVLVHIWFLVFCPRFVKEFKFLSLLPASLFWAAISALFNTIIYGQILAQIRNKVPMWFGPAKLQCLAYILHFPHFF